MKTIKQQKQEAKAQAECDRWNELNPEGSSVTLTKDSGTVMHTKTRSAAYVCASGYAVIFLEGVSGYYLLDRVERRAEPIEIEVTT